MANKQEAAAYVEQVAREEEEEEILWSRFSGFTGFTVHLILWKKVLTR